MLSLDRIYCRQYLIESFGNVVANTIMDAPNPTILSIITYGSEWDVTIHILLYSDGS